jgi:chromosome partitioning protein
MSARVIAVVNMKGGVGKSSTIVGLAEALATKESNPVLVIDADTQATASFCLAGGATLKKLHDSSPPKTLDEFMKRRFVAGDQTARLSDFIQKQVSHTTIKRPDLPSTTLDISLVASSTTLRLSEREVLRKLSSNMRSLVEIEGAITAVLKDEIRRLSNQFEHILIDCAPGISPLTTAAIAIADLVLVPTVPDAPSFLGLAAFLNSVHAEMTFDSARRPPHVLITRLPPKQSRTSTWMLGSKKKVLSDHYYQHFEKIKELAKSSNPAFVVLDTIIPESRDMPQALSLGGDSDITAFTYNQKYGTLAKSLDKLADEITKVLK